MESLENLILTRQERGIIDIPVELDLILVRNQLTNSFIHACEEGFNSNQFHRSFRNIEIPQYQIDLVEPGQYIPLNVSGGDGWANWYYFRPNQTQHVLITITIFVNESNVTVSEVSEQRPQTDFREENDFEILTNTVQR